MSGHDQREETLFEAALQRVTPEERAAYLKDACPDDEPLRQRIAALLQAHDQTDALLDKPVAGLPARTLVPDPGLIQPTEKAGDKIGRYKLLQQIGEGGCGVVYMAEQEEPVRRRVALKVIKLGMDTKSVIARFEAERQALAMMDHPNIAKVLDAGATATGRPYFVMELVRGIRITDYCDEQKLSTRQRLDLFIQVCNAIQHAHQKGIIHRDIKPSNILVTVNDGVPVPKVIDFGIAKATGGVQLTDKTVFTAFEQFIGTPAYMSPEQAMMTSVDIDTRSDIYALGVLLYELLTGKTPFDTKELLAAGLDEMRRTIREKEPERPSTRVSTLPHLELSTAAQRRGLDAPKLVSQLRGDLDWIVMKALEKDRARRYETANGLASDVHRHLRNEPVLACPPSNLYRLRKMVRRNKLAFAAGLSVATVLLLGFGVSFWMFVRERKALHEQVRFRELAQANEKKAQLEAVHNRAIVAEFNVDFYMSGTNYADADSILTNLLTAEDALQSMNARLLAVRAYYMARRGHLREAAGDFWKLIEFEPMNCKHYFHLAPLLLINEDFTGYRHVRDLMLARFGETNGAQYGDFVAKACLLLPPPEKDLEHLAQLAEIALTAQHTGPEPNVPWFHLSKGLADYRQRHFQRSVEWMHKTLSEPLRFTDDYRFFAAYAVLAMAHYRLGQMDDARAAFANTLEYAQTRLPHLESADLGDWRNLLIGHILMREAKALIEGGAENKMESK